MLYDFKYASDSMIATGRSLHHINSSTASILQLTSKTPETYLDLADDDDSLKQMGFSNGQIVRNQTCAVSRTVGRHSCT